LKVLIVGGGTAALEAAFRLQRVAAAQVEMTILAPDDHFVTHAMAVLVPFASGHLPKEPLARLAADAGARLRTGRMASVDSAAHEVVTADGEALPYDALLIAIGGVQRSPLPHALTFGAAGSEERMHGLVQDLEYGYVRSIAFVVPPEATWPVPLYELALMAAGRAYDQCQHCVVTVATHERAPLEMFGPEVSQALASRLGAAGIAIRTGVQASVRKAGELQFGGQVEHLDVDRIVTLPVLDGPAVTGLPHDARGFLPVDEHGRVEGVRDVYAAGDVTHHPVKQGGLACQLADAAAEAIAARAGVAIEPKPYTPTLRGVLLTGRGAIALGRDDAAAGDVPDIAEGALWWPLTKIAGQELARHIAGLPGRVASTSSERVGARRSGAGA
jgi:sulfide:quinone oxidoreductase